MENQLATPPVVLNVVLPGSVLTRKKQYVLGFAMNEEHNQMLLAVKNRPEVQQGLLNGLGGEKNPVESPVQAMIREFREECGIETNKDQWNSFHRLEGFDYIVYCYAITLDITQARQKTDEELEVHFINDYMGWRSLELAAHRVVPDLRFLVPMAVEAERVRLQRF
jgi:8-oxo-dGTP diphosphatase